MFTAKETQTFVANKFIECQFNIAGSPWWERLVSCVKQCIKKFVGVQKIGYRVTNAAPQGRTYPESLTTLP